MIGPASVGEPCTVTVFQKFCQMEAGFGKGYRDTHDICRAVCRTDDECTEEGHTCRFFLGEEGLGYCGPVPTDG